MLLPIIDHVCERGKVIFCFITVGQSQVFWLGDNGSQDASRGKEDLEPLTSAVIF